MCLAVTVGVLAVRHRRALAGSYALPAPPPVTDRPLLLLATGVCLALGPLFVSGVPVWATAAAAAAVLVVAARRRGRRDVGPALVPWRLLVLVVGLFLVVGALGAHGLTGVLAAVAGTGEGPAALLRLSGTSALLANLTDNLPAYLAAEPVAGSPPRLLALLVGVDAGPLVTPWASLATLLWLERCRTAGVTVGRGRFAREGLLLVVLVVPAGALAVALTT